MTTDSKRTNKAKRRDAERKAAREAKRWLNTRAQHVAMYEAGR